MGYIKQNVLASYASLKGALGSLTRLAQLFKYILRVCFYNLVNFTRFFNCGKKDIKLDIVENKFDYWYACLLNFKHMACILVFRQHFYKAFEEVNPCDILASKDTNGIDVSSRKVHIQKV